MSSSVASTCTVPDLVPISDLRQRQVEILEMLQRGPITLTQRGRAAAVMISPEQWNVIIEELEDLRDALDAIEALEEVERDPDSIRPWEEVRQEFVAKGLLDD